MDKSLNLFFPNASINIDEDEIYTISSQGKCIDFFIDTDRNEKLYIGIKQLNKCKISGSEILERIELFANNSNISYIILDDKSSLNIGDIDINFAILYILSSGYSWYNKFGYYQYNYVKERKQWNRIREITFRDCEFFFRNLKYNDITPNNYYMDAIQYYMEISDIIITKDNYMEGIIDCFDYILINIEDLVDISIKEASSLIFLAIKNKIYDNNEEIFLKYIFFISFLSYIIPYTRCTLTKTIE